MESRKNFDPVSSFPKGLAEGSESGGQAETQRSPSPEEYGQLVGGGEQVILHTQAEYPRPARVEPQEGEL